MFSRFKPSTWLIALFVILPSFSGTAQQGDSNSDEEKRRRFLKAREEMTASPASAPEPSPSSSEPKPKPKPKPHSAPTPTPVKKPAPVPNSPNPSPSTPKTAPANPPQSAPTKPERPASKPEPKAVPTPQPPPSTSVPDAPVVIEKSSVEQKAPIQAAPSTGFFGWFSRWKYLSKSIREEIDKAPVEKGRWRYIVVHNSGTRQGNAKAFDYYHTNVRKMSNGLAYQFVIGNGTSSADGQIEIGPRWKRQINGGHVHSDYLNNIALGICLVGDFNQEEPTAKQLEALDELIRYLRQRVGKTEGKWAIVKAHKEINPPRWPTDCPGNDFPYRWLHNRFD